MLFKQPGELVNDVTKQASESNIRSFIVKIWTERAIGGTGKKTWHGYITAVPGGERRYLKELTDITDMIAAHLEMMGVSRRGYCWVQRVRELFRRLRSQVSRWRKRAE